MAHVREIARNELDELQAVLNGAEATMGFVPNSMLTMAHMPQLTMAFSMLAGVVFGADLKALFAHYADHVPDTHRHGDDSAALNPDLIQLIAYSVSLSAGCRYCQAHTSHNANRLGIAEEKLQQVLQYETSSAFTAAEKAVIAVALAAGQVPNECDAAQFEALQAHFSERQIVQIVGVIALFGFLNRWNDTMATQLEETPTKFAQRVLAEGGWQLDKHAG
ncbi:MAG: carboxymuconolactone decarboxylase family protein [Pseudomonadota bacterium]